MTRKVLAGVVSGETLGQQLWALREPRPFLALGAAIGARVDEAPFLPVAVDRAVVSAVSIASAHEAVPSPGCELSQV